MVTRAYCGPILDTPLLIPACVFLPPMPQFVRGSPEISLIAVFHGSCTGRIYPWLEPGLLEPFFSHPIPFMQHKGAKPWAMICPLDPLLLTQSIPPMQTMHFPCASALSCLYLSRYLHGHLHHSIWQPTGSLVMHLCPTRKPVWLMICI